MASYSDIRTILYADDSLRNNVFIATTVAANDILSKPSPTQDEVKWASSVLGSPEIEGMKAFRSILAKYKDSSVAVIKASGDPTIQAAVDSIAPLLVIAFNAV